MPKNITIAEGSQAKNFNTVHKLRTNVIGGGTQYWVPEDEAGAYANMGQKSITANGTYKASDDSKDGFSQVIVNVPPKEAHLSTKSITANGIYRGIDDGVDGFSQVNVNVAGVGEATVTLDEPIGGDGNEHHISSDPRTGAVEDFVLPSSIQITTSANKLSYIDGESIDITGMVVKAYKKDGTLWESTGYSGGIIPNSELIIEPRIAHTDGSAWSDEDGVNATTVDLDVDGISSKIMGTYRLEPFMIGQPEEGYARLLITKYQDKIWAMRTDGDNFNFNMYTYRDSALVLIGFTDYRTTLNKWTTATWHDSITNVAISTKSPANAGRMVSVGMMVTVKWNRPKDNKALRVNYGVTVH